MKKAVHFCNWQEFDVSEDPIAEAVSIFIVAYRHNRFRFNAKEADETVIVKVTKEIFNCFPTSDC